MVITVIKIVIIIIIILIIIIIIIIIIMTITMAILIINNINDGNMHFCNTNVQCVIKATNDIKIQLADNM